MLLFFWGGRGRRGGKRPKKEKEKEPFFPNVNWEATRCRASAAPGPPSSCVDLKAPPCVSPGTFRGVCKKIDHFPEDADYEQDTAEYLLRESAAPHIALSPIFNASPQCIPQLPASTAPGSQHGPPELG